MGCGKMPHPCCQFQTMKEYPNLIPNSERSPEELREMGRKGGIKSGESRRKKKELLWQAKIIWEVMEELQSNEEARGKLEKMLHFLVKSVK